MQPLPSASTWAGPRLRPRRRQLQAELPAPTERATALAAECQQLLDEAQRVLNRLIERPWAQPARQEERRSRAVIAALRNRARALVARLDSRYPLAALILLLSLVPSLIFYQVRVRHVRRPAPVPRAAPSPPARVTPVRHQAPVGVAIATAPPPRLAGIHLGQIGGIHYRYSHEGDGMRVLIEPIAARNSLVLASIVVAVIEDTYGPNKLVSLIPYVVPGESGNWLKFQGRDSDYFAAFSYGAEDPARVSGCYVWARPKD